MSFGFRMTVPTKEGIEVTLRPYLEGEEKHLVRGMSSFEVARYLATRHAQTLESEREWIAKIRQDDKCCSWAICIQGESGEVPIGSTTLHFSSHQRATSGIAIYDRDWWGRGVASAAHRARTLYAFDVLDLMAIDSEVVQGNLGSLKALQGVGYAIVGANYHRSFADGQVKHSDQLLVVNPSKRAWHYFWGETTPPPELEQSRLTTLAVLDWARQNVKFDY